MQKCPWALNDPYSESYHDEEWCIPHKDDTYLFEMLILEGAQAGLSWSTILKRRAAYQETFFHFDLQKCAALSDEQIDRILETAPIIRNRRKVASVRKNALAVLEIQKEFGSFADYLWAFTDGHPVINHWKSAEEMPAKSPLSEKVSRDLKKRGCAFVGPVIIYSFLQAAGMIDDHLITCPFHSSNKKRKQT